MHKLLFTLIFIIFSFSAPAQDIPVDFTNNPARPYVFENPGTGKTLLFFYQENFRFNKRYPVKAYECDAASMQVLRTSPELSIPLRGEQDTKLRLLCHIYRGNDYFFILENDGIYRVYRIAGEDLTLQQVDSLKAGKGERIINGVSDGTNGYLLCTRESKKEGDQLLVYRIGDGGRLEKHTVPVSARREELVDDIFRNKFKPLAVQYGKELDPEKASNKVKLFAGDQKLWITFDNANIGSIQTNLTAILKVGTIDLTKDTLSLKRYYYTDSLAPDAGRERRSSYIFDGKLFQLYMNNEQLLLRVRDLETGKALFTKALLREDSIEGLANSPIKIPGRGLLGVEKEYRSVRKFMRRFSTFSPSLQVRRAGDDYLLCIGGHEEGATPMAPGFGNPVPGAWGPGTTGGYSYERSFSFYSAVNAQTMTRSGVFFKKPLIAAYEDMLKSMENPPDHALYTVGGRFYMGYFDKKEKRYRFKQIENY